MIRRRSLANLRRPDVQLESLEADTLSLFEDMRRQRKYEDEQREQPIQSGQRS